MIVNFKNFKQRSKSFICEFLFAFFYFDSDLFVHLLVLRFCFASRRFLSFWFSSLVNFYREYHSSSIAGLYSIVSSTPAAVVRSECVNSGMDKFYDDKFVSNFGKTLWLRHVLWIQLIRFEHADLLFYFRQTIGHWSENNRWDMSWVRRELLQFRIAAPA